MYRTHWLSQNSVWPQVSWGLNLNWSSCAGCCLYRLPTVYLLQTAATSQHLQMPLKTVSLLFPFFGDIFVMHSKAALVVYSLGIEA